MTLGATHWVWRGDLGLFMCSVLDGSVDDLHKRRSLHGSTYSSTIASSESKTKSLASRLHTGAELLLLLLLLPLLMELPARLAAFKM